ncbi:isoaspartyl peptidase/L-asparaginase family protein [Hyphobacterium marinum]|uniref:Isoaspartyl peptidase/L-asparaginase n=1 Tax=Hyphobacterium marinum TaxID=3116574 RepID=A0ABU7LZY3_9PROT|nr:isoaspartyl peptidase/L-asparaginase [Hyphobacterium sp. Y6023]MEE2567132.1 isoaspartyl peptidase/L-asparaginase [Hyphobacterium sp. Y6023]
MIRSLSLLAAMALSATAHAQDRPEWAIVVHGGAGVIERDSMDAETDAAYRAAMNRALETGSAILSEGGTALDAIEAVIREMEDDILFNAGRGAVFTAAGQNELDASIMDGATLNAGAVAGVTQVRHPITLARSVMENSRHLMFTGAGAETFAAEQGMELVDPAWFFTERRWQALERALTAQGLPIPERPEGAPEPEPVDHTLLERLDREHRFGTVGVVALDSDGNIAAGTSTGGLTAKRWGRVGDSPIIGAGTYASNNSCGVSGTGTGEYFIRLTIAREICALVEYQDMSLQAAADEVIQNRLTALGGDGGIVALTPDGEIAWSFNTPGMYRASLTAGGAPRVAIYGDED